MVDSLLSVSDECAMDIELRLSEFESDLAGYQSALARTTSVRASESEDEKARRTELEAYIQRRIGEVESQKQIRLAQRHALEIGLSEPRRRLSDTTNDLIEHLDAGNLDGARKAFAHLAAHPLWLESKIDELHLRASRTGRVPVLFDLFVDAGPRSLTRLKLISSVIQLGVQSGRRNQVLRLVTEVHEGADRQVVRFGQNDLMRKLCTRDEFDPELRRLLSAIKYHGLNKDSGEDVFAAAEQLAERLDINPSLAEHLYAHRQDRSLDLAGWLRRHQAASCLAHLLEDRPRAFSQNWKAIVDKIWEAEALRGALEKAGLSEGGVLTTFHGGFVRMELDFLTEAVPNSVILRTGKAEGAISVWENPAAGLMMALRAVLEGKTILMAADGRRGNPSHGIEVLGRYVPMATGAALIAYESGCSIAWYTVTPQDGRLVPIVIPAPKVEKRESFDSFAARWLIFYQDRIRDVMTGDPGQLALLPRWNTLALWDRPNALGKSEEDVEIERKGRKQRSGKTRSGRKRDINKVEFGI